MGIFDFLKAKEENKKEENKEETKEPTTKDTETKVKENNHTYKHKQQYHKEIDTGKLNSYQTVLTNEINYIGKMDERILNKYDQLLKGKVYDKQIKKELIETSEITLKERCTMEIVLEGENYTNKGAFEIIGILPEYEQHIREYFIGRTIPYNKWHTIIKDFQTYLNQIGKGVKAINSKLAITEDLTVLRAKINCTFK